MKSNRAIKKIFSTGCVIAEAQDFLNKAKEYALQNTADSDSLYDVAIENVLVKTEKAYLQTRRLASETVSSQAAYNAIKKEEMLNDQIKILLLDSGIIKISMPIILPFKKLKEFKSYPFGVKKISEKETFEKANALLFLLREELKKFKKETNFSNFSADRITFLYRNCINTDRLYSIPDCDNYEYKQITDTIAASLFYGSDGYDVFNYAIKTECSSFTKTEVYIIPNLDLFDCIFSHINLERSNKIKFPKTDDFRAA